ncbi:MAG: Hpt domain-containing protein, partial [Candidatus Kuenenia sp.]|nr:Hpt domain-containing protein [Candidatus Kuenenia sp.]
MSEREIEFQKRLLATFKIEAEEHIKEMSVDLLKMEENPPVHEQMQIIEKIFREAHNLKGAARAVNLFSIEKICQSLETVFSNMKHGGLQLSKREYDLLHDALDSIGRILFSPEGSSDISTLVRRIEGLVSGESSDEALSGAPPQSFVEACLQRDVKDKSVEDDAINMVEDESIAGEKAVHTAMKEGGIIRRETSHAKVLRVASSKLDTLFFKAEEMLSLKQVSLLRASELLRISTILDDWERKWTKVYSSVRKTVLLQGEMESEKDGGKRNSEHIDSLSEFLEWNHNFMKTLEEEINVLAGCTKRDHRMIAGMVDELLEDVKKILMMPFSSILETFPKVVRDISRNQAKDINLLISGGEVEVDKRILEEIKDPLMHMVRNCIDHGIEKIQER